MAICPSIVLIVQSRCQSTTILLGLRYTLGKRVKSNHKIRLIRPIPTCGMKKCAPATQKHRSRKFDWGNISLKHKGPKNGGGCTQTRGACHRGAMSASSASAVAVSDASSAPEKEVSEAGVSRRSTASATSEGGGGGTAKASSATKNDDDAPDFGGGDGDCDDDDDDDRDGSTNSMPSPGSSPNPNLSPSPSPSPREMMEDLLGYRVRCTLDDGRTAEGKFVCLDRL